MESKDYLEQLASFVQAVGSGSTPEVGEIAKSFPALWSVLCQSQYANGKPRETGTLTLWPDSGTVQMVLNARAEGMKLYAESVSLEGIWEALEAKITGPEPGWKETPEARRKRLAQKRENGT